MKNSIKLFIKVSFSLFLVSFPILAMESSFTDEGIGDMEVEGQQSADWGRNYTEGLWLMQEIDTLSMPEEKNGFQVFANMNTDSYFMTSLLDTFFILHEQSEKIRRINCSPNSFHIWEPTANAEKIILHQMPFLLDYLMAGLKGNDAQLFFAKASLHMKTRSIDSQTRNKVIQILKHFSRLSEKYTSAELISAAIEFLILPSKDYQPQPLTYSRAHYYTLERFVPAPNFNTQGTLKGRIASLRNYR